MDNINFEKAMERLEEIVSELEHGTATLEQSIKLFEEGNALLSGCYSLLETAEKSVALYKFGENSELSVTEAFGDTL